MSMFFVPGILDTFLELFESFLETFICVIWPSHSWLYHHSVWMPLATGFISEFTPSAWHKEWVCSTADWDSSGKTELVQGTQVKNNLWHRQKKKKKSNMYHQQMYYTDSILVSSNS